MVGAWALGYPLYQCHLGKLLDFGLSCRGGGDRGCVGDPNGEFPSFLPKEVHKIRDPFARNLAQRIQRLPVQVVLRTFAIACKRADMENVLRMGSANQYLFNISFVKLLLVGYEFLYVYQTGN